MKNIGRLLVIYKTLLSFQLDDLLFDNALLKPYRFLRYLSPWRYLSTHKKQPRAERIRLALEQLGPIFIKFGQTLSTRQDLLPEDVGLELGKLQDTCPAFAGEKALAIAEKALAAPIDRFFRSFDKTPLAAASIAQIHAATTLTGEDVIVKIVRPDVKEKIKRDLDMLYGLAKLISRHPEIARLNLVDVVRQFDTIINSELDMYLEAANASLLAKNFANSDLLKVPKIYWQLTRQNVLVMERMYGTPINQIAKLKEKNIDLKQLAQRGVEIFFTQVFEDNFFHADMHAGNILISDEGQYIALDFGIMGTLNKEDLYYLAKNFIAFFNRDYQAVATVHLASGWVPAHLNPIELENTFRSICEPIFNKPLKEISFGKALINLFRAAKRFDIKVQPQLFLFDKTLLNVEGLGRQLDDELDLWQTAKPFLEHSFKKQQKKVRKQQLKKLKQQLPTLPFLTIEALNKAVQSNEKTPQQTTNNNHYAFAVVGALLAIALLLPSVGFSPAVIALTVLLAWFVYKL